MHTRETLTKGSRYRLAQAAGMYPGNTLALHLCLSFTQRPRMYPCRAF